MDYLKLIKTAEKLDELKLYKQADEFISIVYKFAQSDQPKIDLKLGGEGSPLNDPKNAEDYFLGIAFDVIVNKNKDKNSANDEMLRFLKLQNEKLPIDDKVKEDSEFWKNMLEKLQTMSWWQNAPEFDPNFGQKIEVTGQPKDFINKLSSAAQQASSYFDNEIPPSFILALAAWESGWGKSKLASEYGNYFGIKQSPTSGSQSSVSMSTFEFDGGKHQEMADFATFEDGAVSAMTALPSFLKNNPRYSKAFEYGNQYKLTKSKSDLFNLIDSVFDAGYSTDPNEPTNIKKLIIQYDLTRFDT